MLLRAEALVLRARGQPPPALATAEPAWHRRQRRARQWARGVIALQRAYSVHSAHHGGGMGKGGQKGNNIKFNDWRCPINDCSFLNYGFRSRCKRCDAYPSPPRIPKGAGKGSGGHTSLAQRQIATERASLREKQQAEQAEKLRKRVAELEQKLEATNATNDDIDDGGDDPMESKEELAKELETERKRKKLLQDLCDADHPYIAQTDIKIKELVKKRDEHKPQRARIRDIEKKIDRYQRRLSTRTSKWRTSTKRSPSWRGATSKEGRG